MFQIRRTLVTLALLGLGLPACTYPDGVEAAPAGAARARECPCAVDRTLAVSLLFSGDDSPGHLVPKVRDGEVDGLTFYSRAPGETGSAVGLEDGDRIVAVNGTHLRSLADLQALRAPLDTAGSIVLAVDRAGVETTIEWTLR